jgi:hypothetical protein
MSLCFPVAARSWAPSLCLCKSRPQQQLERLPCPLHAAHHLIQPLLPCVLVPVQPSPSPSHSAITVAALSSPRSCPASNRQGL